MGRFLTIKRNSKRGVDTIRSDVLAPAKSSLRRRIGDQFAGAGKVAFHGRFGIGDLRLAIADQAAAIETGKAQDAGAIEGDAGPRPGVHAAAEFHFPRAHQHVGSAADAGLFRAVSRELHLAAGDIERQGRAAMDFFEKADLASRNCH